MTNFAGALDPAVDPFNRDIVAPLYTLTDLVNRYEIDPFELTSSVDGGAHGAVAHVPLKSAIQLSSDGNVLAVARLQTKEFWRYQAGKGLIVLCTIVHGDAGHVGQKRRWGFFDTNDGCYFELDGTTLYAVVRSSVSGVVVETRIAQADWNVDNFDGTGGSAITLDVTKGNIYEIRLQWLGVGVVQFWINGYCAHIFRHPNNLTAPYMRSAQQPLRFEIIQSAGSAAGSMVWICATVLVTGGQAAPEFAFAYSMPAAIVCTTAAPDTFLFALRLAALYKTYENKMHSIPAYLSFAAENNRGAISLLWNPTITAPIVTVSPDSYSSSEIFTSVTAIAAGTEVFRPFVPLNEGVNIDLTALFGHNARRLRQGDTLAVLGRGEVGANSQIRGTLVWREVR